jgi:hypothetical protein
MAATGVERSLPLTGTKGPGWAFGKAGACGQMARPANNFRFSEIVSSEKINRIENISLLQKRKSRHIYRHPVPVRGAYHDRHERGTGCGGSW